ncbi:hypothetical protein SELMODRAFT_156440 [Selaginella moellendorffii]|uniref:Uncharacterized protein n=1 Tax=Selaginella moellendorffii TaxID=88036 RepID=D8SLL5_SELML|nr:mitochondrial carrier protein CoAc1 [Selaginella moellendorffii]EFJ14794.1 hypothetical protein SELMODRAFT_156440 [Selaginella moellendorffii]|eukprot:XP_002984284.1 mitochondrial carrier protein CoAc1 [Selaginella moellendorffii]
MTGQAELNLNGANDTKGVVLLRDSMPIYMREFIAGGIAGGFAKTAVAPLERVKILFQTRLGNFQSMGILRSLRHIHKTEGFWGLYRGNGAAVIRIVPYAALHFMTYERYRQWLVDKCPSAGPSVHLFAGSLAGGTAVLCTYPLDLARTRLAYQATNPHATYSDLGSVFQSVYRQSGIRGLYRGLCPTLYGILPYAGLKFYLYESLQGHLSSEHENSLFAKLACGAVAGLVGQTFTYPLDVVRRQMQVQPAPASGTQEKAFKGTLDALSSVVRNQGWKQTFSGVTINYLKIVPSVAIGFVVYDGMKLWLGIPPRRRPQKE